MSVTFDGSVLKHNNNPVYLGLTLDRSLTYREHLTGLSKKIATRVNIIQKLAGSVWGASANTLRTATLALVFSPAEYVAPAWRNSAHTHKVDVQLNNAMRTITGCVKPTDVRWLPVLSHITPPPIRRLMATKNLYEKFKSNKQSLLYKEIANRPRSRLKARKQSFQDMDGEMNIKELGRQAWRENPPTNGDIVEDPTEEVPGFELKRNLWTTLNRIRTGQGRCNYQLFKWGYKDSPLCTCGDVNQTIHHILEECPGRKFEGDLKDIHYCCPDAIEWMESLDILL